MKVFPKVVLLHLFFSGMVLNRILSNVFRYMKEQAVESYNNKDIEDDGQGGVPLILEYVDDVNDLVYPNFSNLIQKNMASLLEQSLTQRKQE